jgi:CheY-like chemotaxis protein
MNEDEITILIVDDEPALREIFSGWVESLQCGKVLTANDGMEALEILKTNNVTLLITDVRMPRMDGAELVKRLSQLVRIPSIVFVSAFSDVDEREMYQLGAESFLTKPLHKEDLTRAVERALAKPSDLWITPPEKPARQAIVIGDPNISTGTDEHYFLLGRGGFCARYSGTIGLGKVDFACHLADGHTTLCGSGVVRWRARGDGLVGIEFSYLDEGSQAYVVGEIAASMPHNYIPSNVT